MQKPSVRAFVPAALLCLALCLAITSGCGTDETLHPFGPEPRGTPIGGTGTGGSTVLVPGSAGSSGALTILTGEGGAGSSDGATGGTAGIPGQSTGGKNGKGGDTGSGGANAAGAGGARAAAGGSPGTGGAIGSGGARSGGASGSGGARGTGGAIGTGGASATGGASGTGGAVGISAACQQHIADYDAELQSARMCKVNAAKTCATLVPQRLSGCGSGCFTYVDKATMLDQIAKQWSADGCTAAPCPLEVCVNPVLSTCSIVTSLCTDVAL